MSALRCFFFGCWNRAGHFLHHPGGVTVSYAREDGIVFYGAKPERHHLDSSLAPRRDRDGRIVWSGQGKTHDDANRITYASSECPQGEFLLHHLDNGFTAISWWDRNQGDGRGACNSTVLLEGKYDSAVMKAALAEHFPHVLQNLDRAGISLVEVVR